MGFGRHPFNLRRVLCRERHLPLQLERMASYPREASTCAIQLINDTQQLQQEEFDKKINSQWNLSAAGTDYHVVAVLGSQSSGKSTLLNALFGTEFEVLAEGRRTQTTRGIWMAKSPIASGLLVMDVEGTDGRERGEDQDFERKSALFSMAIAHVLIVNMWEHSVGLYNGANLALLRTVFEVNLELFGSKSSPKTILLFVIRDFLGSTPLSVLAEGMLQDLERIWKGLTKSDAFSDTKLGDFFLVQFTALPHKLLQPENFSQECENLRLRFVDKSAENFIFPKVAGEKTVPIDGLAVYASGIWNRILENKDLDLPTQLELLSQFRCEEIKLSILDSFSSTIASISSGSAEHRLPNSFWTAAAEERANSLDRFAISAHRYQPKFVEKTCLDLTSKINSILEAVCLQQGRVFVKDALQLFTSTFDMSKKEPKFSACIENSQKAAKEKFSSDSMVFEKIGYPLVLEQVSVEFLDQLGQKTFRLVSTQCRRIGEERLRVSNERVHGLLKKHFSLIEGDSSFWTFLSTKLEEHLSGAVGAVCILLAENLASDEFVQEYRAEFSSSISNHAVQQICEFFSAENLQQSFTLLFEKQFRYSASTGMPEIWTSGSDIDFAYQRSVDKCFTFIDELGEYDAKLLLKSLCLSPDASSKLENLFLDDFFAALKEALRKHFEFLYLETKRTVLANRTSIPTWILILLAALIWRELLAVIKNPLYSFFLIFLCFGALVVYRLHLYYSLVEFLRQAIFR